MGEIGLRRSVEKDFQSLINRNYNELKRPAAMLAFLFLADQYFYFYLKKLMNSRLQSLFDSIEAQRHSLLSSVKDLPSEKLNDHALNKWSINEIISHLIAAEKLSLQYISKKMLGLEQSTDTGVYEELKMVLLQISQRLPLKFKAPKKVVENTFPEKDVTKLIEQWNDVRQELKSILERFEDHQIRRGVYRHVRVGMLNIQHAVKFFGEHVTHHTPQIRRQL